MATYTKFSELTGANQTALITAVHPAGTANTSVILQEYIFTEDNELDYSASFTDGMSAATVTFTQLPATTRAIHLLLQLQDTGSSVSFRWKRSSGATVQYAVLGAWGDVGTNILYVPVWVATNDNSIYVNTVEADTLSNVYVIGYKTGA